MDAPPCQRRRHRRGDEEGGVDDSERLAPLAFHSAHYNEQGQRRPSVSRESFATAMSVYEFRWCVMGTVFNFILIANLMGLAVCRVVVLVCGYCAVQFLGV